MALALALAFAMSACGGRVELVSHLSESEANAVLGALLSANIGAEKVARKGGISVEVDAERVSSAIDVLDRQGLPRAQRTRMGDVFKKENLISSPLEERARYIYALSQELEDTLLKIDGVVAARVHVVLPERLVPGEPAMPSSASVFVKHQPEVPFDAVVPKITSLVATSIPGLVDKKVTVVLVPARPLAGAQSRSEQTERVLFFQVQKDSAAGLRALLGALAAAMVLGLCAFGALAWLCREPLRRYLPWRPAARTVTGRASVPR